MNGLGGGGGRDRKAFPPMVPPTHGFSKLLELSLKSRLGFGISLGRASQEGGPREHTTSFGLRAPPLIGDSDILVLPRPPSLRSSPEV